MSKPTIVKEEDLWVVVWPGYGFVGELALGYETWGEAMAAANRRTLSSGTFIVHSVQDDYFDSMAVES